MRINKRSALRALAGSACAVATPWLQASTAASAPVAAPTAAAPGQLVAWPEVALLDGQPLAPATWRGQAAVVVFWTTTCPFCRRHNQHVEKLHRAVAGKPLRVLGVARERDAAAVRRYVQAQGYTFPITLDHLPMARALSMRRIIPLTTTVDRQGRLQQVIPGEMIEEDLLELLALGG